MDTDMNTPFEQPIDVELLIRFLSGEANMQEMSDVQQWINADARHKKYINELTLLWKASQRAKDFESINVSEDWKKVTAKINDSAQIGENKPRAKREFFLHQFVRMAAVAILAAGIYFAPYFAIKWSNPATQITAETQSEFFLPDGSKVYLNNNSKLIYPEQFEGKTREVTLTGEAFFEVAKDASRPFIIRSGNSITQVVGTSFNVNSTLSGKVIVSVVTGKVLLHAEADADHKIAMIAGEQGTLEKTGMLTKSTYEDLNFLAWKTGTLTFCNTSLPDVISHLSNYYNQPIQLDSKALENCTLTSTFKKQILSDVLAELQLVLPIIIKREGNVIIITGNGC